MNCNWLPDSSLCYCLRVDAGFLFSYFWRLMLYTGNTLGTLQTNIYYASPSRGKQPMQSLAGLSTTMSFPFLPASPFALFHLHCFPSPPTHSSEHLPLAPGLAQLNSPPPPSSPCTTAPLHQRLPSPLPSSLSTLPLSLGAPSALDPLRLGPINMMRRDPTLIIRLRARRAASRQRRRKLPLRPL